MDEVQDPTQPQPEVIQPAPFDFAAARAAANAPAAPANPQEVGPQQSAPLVADAGAPAEAQPAPSGPQPTPYSVAVESRTDLSPDHVPSWSQVEASDSYQQATPEGRLIAFDRWHNLAYNVAKASPNWDEIKTEFNQKAYDTQTKLSADAGGATPFTARLKVADSVVSNIQDPAEREKALSMLGEDVARDYKNAPTSAIKAGLYGAAKGGFGVAGGMALAAAAEPVNVAVAASTGPFAPLTFGVANALEFLGGMLLAGKGVDSAEKLAAAHSQAIQNIQRDAATHPIATEVGNLIPMVPYAAKSLAGISKVIKTADTAAAATKEIAGRLGGGAAAGAGIEATRPIIEHGLNQVGAAMGLKPDEVQNPTIRSILENAAIGAAVAGVEHETKTTKAQDLINKLREAGAPQTAQTMAEKVGAQPTPTAATEAQPAEVVIRKGEPQLHVDPKATAEDLESVRETVQGSQLTPEQKQLMNDHIDMALRERGVEPAKPAAEEAAPAEAAPAEAAPAEAAPAEGEAVPTQDAGEIRPKTEEEINAELQAGTREPTEATAVNIKPGIVTPEEEARIAKVKEEVAKAAEKGVAPTEGAVARAAGVKQTEEAKAARRDEGTKAVKEVTDTEGAVLSPQEIAQAIGGPPNSKEVTRLHAEEKARLEEKYPAEQPAAGEKETPPIDFKSGYEAERKKIDDQRAALNQELEDLRLKRGSQFSGKEGLNVEQYRDERVRIQDELRELKSRERDLTNSSVPPDVHPVTREHLPTITDAEGNVRPKFTNDPNITAQQIDAGVVNNTDKKLYVPDEIADADKVNPNIHYKWDKAAGKYYVDAADAVIPFHEVSPDGKVRIKSVYARVDEMGKYTDQYKATREEAQKEVSVGLADVLDALMQENAERKAKGQSEMDLNDMVSYRTPEAGDISVAPLHSFADLVKEFGSEAKAIWDSKRRQKVLDDLGFKEPKDWNTKKDGQYDRFGTILKNIAKGTVPGTTEFQKEVAKLVLQSGLETHRIAFKVNTAMDSAGLFWRTRPESLFGLPKTIREGQWIRDSEININPDVDHRSGIIGTVLHEAYHAVTAMKLLPEYRYKLNAAERTAVENLTQIHEVATREVLNRVLGRPPTQEEINRFRDVIRNQTLLDNKVPLDAAIMKHDDLLAHGYGFTNLIEFATEVQSNPHFLTMLADMKPFPKMPHPSGEGVYKNMLTAFKDWMKQLFVGKPVPKESIAYQALEHTQNLARETQTAARAFEESAAEAKKIVTPKEPRFAAEAERLKLSTPEQAAAHDQQVESLRPVALEKLRRGEQLTPDEQRAASSATAVQERRGAKNEAAVDLGTTPEAVQSDGWVTPDGRYVPNLEGRAHDETILRHLAKENPALFKEIGGKVDKKGNVTLSVDALDTLHQRAMEAGYLRVVGAKEGDTIHFEGNPTSSQRRLLRDAALMQQSDLVQDLGGSRTRTVAEASTAVPPPPAGEEKVHLEQRLGVKGRVRHDLTWDPEATRGDLLAFSERLDTDPNIADVDKRRMKQQIAEALGPTVTMKQGKDNTVAGYDSANNIANADARRARNDIIQLSGFGDPRKLTHEQRMDLDSAPFVIEAGGKKSKLLEDMVKVRDSEKLSDAEKDRWLPVMQRAYDNFEDLSKKTGVYQKIMKEQLMRERANGVQTGNVENYVTHLLEKAENKDFWANLLHIDDAKGGGVGSRYFIKGRHFADFADALANGYLPKSDAESIFAKTGLTKGLQTGDEGFASNLADLAQRRVEVGQRLVRQKAFEDTLRATKLPDGRAIIAPMEEYSNFAGKEGYQRVPNGYQVVSTGIKPLVVAKEFAPMFNALYGRSALDGNALARFIKMGTGFLKRNTLMFDSYHVGRIAFKEAAFAKGANRIGYKNGLSLLEYSPEAMDSMLKDGTISESMHKFYTENAPTAKLLMEHGLNVGTVSDNLVAAHSTSLPFIKNFNPWVFQKLSRGAMMQSALDNFTRNMKRFPERGVEGNARQTAKEMNEVFGNLQNQSIFKNKTFQDLNRVVALAPQWAESQLIAEGRGYGQLLKAPLDLARGKARLGVVAQGNLNIVLGMLAAGQVMNYLSRGHSTFQNEGDHKLEAYIPNIEGGKQGFYFNPMEVAGEYAMMAQRYFSQHMTPMDVMARIAGNKLGPAGRSMSELFTGRDYAGRKFESTQDRLRAAMSDLIPTPIGLSSVVERDPRATTGFRMTRTPGAREKTALQSIGLKVAQEMTPRSETFALAYPYREDKSYSDRASEYREMRKALDNDDMASTEKEVRLLVDRGKTYDQIRAGAGISKGGTIEKERFTGGTTTREKEFIHSLTPEQKEIYDQAQRDHVENAKKLRTLLNSLRPELRDKFRANERAHQGLEVSE